MTANDKLFCWCLGILTASAFPGCIAAGIGCVKTAVACCLVGFAAVVVYAVVSLR